MRPRISFVTNATSADGVRLQKFLPQVLQVFHGWIEELIVIVDPQPEQGRIRTLHQSSQVPFVPLEHIISTYSSSIVRFITLEYGMMEHISLSWFAKKRVNRCQNGTPIFAFLYGIERARNAFIFRADCDILFYDKGFINEIMKQAHQFDLIQLPFLNDSDIQFSTRCFFINRERVQQKLPLKPHRLDFLRRVHRRFKGRSVYLALEQIIQREVESGNLTICSLSTILGYTMHIPTRKDFEGLEPIIQRFQQGWIPKAQLDVKHDYNPSLWIDAAIDQVSDAH